jgi:serine/threonine-protein kinase
MKKPDPSPERWQALQQAVDAALDLEPAERGPFLAQSLGDDPELRAEAERLLEACVRAEGVPGLLAASAGEFAAPLLAASPAERQAALHAVLTRALDGRYEVQRELGRGGMASVWLAWDRRHERTVAVKVLESGVAHASADRFLREIRTTARLTHPHVLTLYDSGETDGLLYYVMPYVEGETLRARLVREPRLPVSEALRLLREIADALAYAHARGVVHRDLKPENVLLSGGHAVVMDFGIAKALAASTVAGDAGADLTSIGMVIGTPGYMAPEQALSDPALDHRADLYALGVIGYEMLAGAQPFTGRTGAALVRAGLTETPRPVESRRPDVPAPIARLITRLLARDPAERPQSAAEVLEEIERASTLARTGSSEAAGGFLAELRRRKVFRVAAVYIGSAFVLLQGAELLISALHLPGGLLTVLVVLAIAGLPLALVLAWVFDIVPDARDGAALPRAARSAVLRWGIPVLAVLVLAAATRLAWQRLAQPGDSIRTLAVLPFENTGGAPDDEYFSDGMTDELTHALGRIPGVRLAGRTSSFAFKGKTISAQEVGRALDVGAIVSGSVRRAGERIRVSTQLVSAADGKLLWDSIYESRTGDVFAVQDSLTRAMVGALARALGVRAVAPAQLVASQGTTDLQAYDLYQRGRAQWLLRGAENVARSIQYFHQAIARDPKFARAHAGLALAYAVLPVYVEGSTDTAMTLHEEYARRAVALDSTLADAQAALGLAFERRFRSREAERHYRTALRYEPWNVNARYFLGMMLDGYGREGGLREMRTAVQLDPLAKSTAAGLSMVLLAARRFEEAGAEARRALALDSTFALAELALGNAQMFGGQPDSAVATLERPIARDAPLPELRSALLYASAAAGRWEQAARVRDEIRRLAKNPARDVHVAFAELVFGDPEPAVRVLTTRAGQSDWYWEVGAFGCNPKIDPLWSDARFRRAMRALDVAPCPHARPWPLTPPRPR